MALNAEGKSLSRKSLSKKGSSYTQTLNDEFTETVNGYVKNSHFTSVQELTRQALHEYIQNHPVKKKSKTF